MWKNQRSITILLFTTTFVLIDIVFIRSKINEVDYKVKTKNNPYLISTNGGVLPIHRFTITGGKILNTYRDQNIRRCNEFCLTNKNCDAWELKKEPFFSCTLFQNVPDNRIDFIQAFKNSEENVVGFVQKRSCVLKSKLQKANMKKEDKILYILHFHHEVVPRTLQIIMNQVLPSIWTPNFMDLVVISPQELDLLALNYTFENKRASSLVNPFAPAIDKNNSVAKSAYYKRGANGFMSLPITQAKYPGYKGYLLVNDDAMLKIWDLDQDIWFSNKSWGTFPPHQYSEILQMPRVMKPRYPYGNYGWSWYNFDSGSTGATTGFTRSNFDAALAAMNDLCKNRASFIQDIQQSKQEEFCTKRNETILRPYLSIGGKPDIMYVSGDDSGKRIMKAITLFGEHDVFMAIAFPMILDVFLEKSHVLEMPLCDASINTLKNEWYEGIMKFLPYFKLTKDEGKFLDCPAIHPIKFGMKGALSYWKEIVLNSTCDECTWRDENNTDFWEIV